MIQINKSIFLEMLSLGVLNQKDKDWSVTSINKPASRKKRYVSSGRYEQYLRVKSKQQ